MKKFTGKKVLIVGSGGLRIGQAGEFDYSGSQAIKALKEEGIETILVNPNIATVQTDPGMADKVYLQPLQHDILAKIIAKERPEGILINVGGQTALNLGLELHASGVLKEYGVEILGTSIDAVEKTEDRALFKEVLAEVGLKTAKSEVASTVEEALQAAETLGYPVMMRSGFSLGGLGSGRVSSPQELKRKASEALGAVPQILIEEYLFGWKEVEYEIVRDQYDNALTVCNMENFDPMGIHTGESIVVAPSQTLTDQEYHLLREVALKAVRHLGIVGECNIQYALNPKNGDYRVIEMNARLSRSSALASKATGYPLAFVATKLALGYPLYELRNTITEKTCAFFEPALDYIVVKIPRWDIQKFHSAERQIGSEMKSVGEVMAIGRSFPEALQKALRMLNIGVNGITESPFPIENPEEEIASAAYTRVFAIFQFFLEGASVEEVHALSQIDKWFLQQIKGIAKRKIELQATADERDEKWDKVFWRLIKQEGFSDAEIAKIAGISERQVRNERLEKGVKPYVKQIDTLAGEFEAETNYLYLTYYASESDLSSSAQPAVVILGSGPYCIGSSVEFDWCAVNCARTLRKNGEQTVIVNSNPETVSTDYDESDRLYFEELTFERVCDILDFEQVKGVVVNVGGQIANTLAVPLHEKGYPLLGTPPEAINQAENRYLFSSLLNELGVDQPLWAKVSSLEKAKKFAAGVQYPVLVRPSYVLSGAAMNVAHTEEELECYLEKAAAISNEHPVVISKFITEAKELEIDGVAKDGEIVIQAIAEHIEHAGVHSGDATIVLPPQRLYLETIRRTKAITRAIAAALRITGPFNIQYIAKDNAIQVIECNLHASRSFPFVSKVKGHNFIEMATEVLLGKLVPKQYETLEFDYVGVKCPQFSYQRLKGADPVAHVEMASTGEVACIGENYLEAFYTSWLATDQKVLGKKILVSIGGNKKVKLLEEIKRLEAKGWEIYATEGTHRFLAKNGVGAYLLYKASDEIEPNVATALLCHRVDLIINIPSGESSAVQSDGFLIRRLSIDNHLPLITNLPLAQLLLKCLAEIEPRAIEVKSLQEYRQSDWSRRYDAAYTALS